MRRTFFLFLTICLAIATSAPAADSDRAYVDGWEPTGEGVIATAESANEIASVILRTSFRDSGIAIDETVLEGLQVKQDGDLWIVWYSSPQFTENGSLRMGGGDLTIILNKNDARVEGKFASQ
jgi:hypothetical protein